MSFLEDPRFPDFLMAFAQGGAGWLTIPARTYGGNEYRNQQWQFPLAKFAIQDAFTTVNSRMTAYNEYLLVNFQMDRAGMFGGFRVNNPRDATASDMNGTGYIGIGGVGEGTPTLQMFKLYGVGSEGGLRKILKPWATGITFTRNAGPYGAAYDYTTGVITMASDHAQSIASITPGTTTVVNVGSPLTGASAGKLVYLSGIVGTIDNQLNLQAWPILGAIGTAITIDVDTTGYAYTSGGTAAMYPQASDVLRWLGPFDTPMRFDDDDMNNGLDMSGALVDWQSLKLTELRNP